MSEFERLLDGLIAEVHVFGNAERGRAALMAHHERALAERDARIAELERILQFYTLVAQTRVRRRLKATTKTGDSRRVILPPIVWQMLEGNPTRFAKSFVFLTPEGHPFLDADWLMEHWQKAHARAKVRRRLGLYPWRSTYISLALSHGASLLWTARQAGHDVVTMEKHYARWVEGRSDADSAELRKVYQ